MNEVLDILNRIYPSDYDRLYNDLSNVLRSYPRTTIAYSEQELGIPNLVPGVNLNVRLDCFYSGSHNIVMVELFVPKWYPSWSPYCKIILPQGYMYAPAFERGRGNIRPPIIQNWNSQYTLLDILQSLSTFFTEPPFYPQGVNLSYSNENEMNQVQKDIKYQLQEEYTGFNTQFHEIKKEILDYKSEFLKDSTTLKEGLRALDQQIQQLLSIKQTYQDHLNQNQRVNTQQTELEPIHYLICDNSLTEQLILQYSRNRAYTSQIQYIYKNKDLNIEEKLKILCMIAKQKYEAQYMCYKITEQQQQQFQH